MEGLQLVVHMQAVAMTQQAATFEAQLSDAREVNDVLITTVKASRRPLISAPSLNERSIQVRMTTRSPYWSCWS